MIFDRFFANREQEAKEEEVRSLENPSISLADPRAWLDEFSSNFTEENVSVDAALKVTAVWCAVEFISGTLASLPLQLFRRIPDGREKETTPLARLLHDNPNPEWSSFGWRKYSFEQTLTGGRQFSFIERNRAGQVAAIWPLDPTGMEVVRRDGRKRYEFNDGSSKRVIYQPAEIIDIPYALHSDQLRHRGPIATGANAIGLMIGMERYTASFFRRGAVPPLALEGPLTTPQAVQNAMDDINRAIKDAVAEGKKVLALPIGHTLSQLGFRPEESQLIEGRRYMIEEIARLYQLPPVFLQDLSHGTFSNTEQQDLHFVKHSLRRWISQTEHELNLKLFGPTNNSRFVEFNVDALLRGDFQARMQGHATAIQNAISTPNEAREKENRPPLPGGGDLMIQGATVPVGSQPTNDNEVQPDDDQDDE